MSSDLEDCEELWMGDLGNYIIETHKRQKQVDAWFSRWIIVSIAKPAYGVLSLTTLCRNATLSLHITCPTCIETALHASPFHARQSPLSPLYKKTQLCEPSPPPSSL